MLSTCCWHGRPDALVRTDPLRDTVQTVVPQLLLSTPFHFSTNPKHAGQSRERPMYAITDAGSTACTWPTTFTWQSVTPVTTPKPCLTQEVKPPKTVPLQRTPVFYRHVYIWHVAKNCSRESVHHCYYCSIFKDTSVYPAFEIQCDACYVHLFRLLYLATRDSHPSSYLQRSAVYKHTARDAMYIP